MLFWPLVIISLVALSLFLVGPPSGAFIASEDAELRLVYLIVLTAGITIAGAGRLLMRGGARTARFAVVWIGVFAGLFTAFTHRDSLHEDMIALYDRARGNIHPSVALATPQGEAELRRNWDGHYRAEAEVNGVRLHLMIDTGASMVLIPYEDARSVGINPDNLDFSLPVATANGKSSVAPITLSSIKIGPIAVFDVQAAVAHPGRLKTGLLGMSFLDKLDETSFRGNRLLLRN
jgi:aspartyl protease family protein